MLVVVCTVVIGHTNDTIYKLIQFTNYFTIPNEPNETVMLLFVTVSLDVNIKCLVTLQDMTIYKQLTQIDLTQ